MKRAAMWLPLLVFCSLSCGSTVIAQDSDQLASASTVFTKDILQVLVQNEPGNVIVSPISISSLLAMLQQGAKNVTAEQLETVLHIAAEPAASGFGTLVQTFTKRKYKSKVEFNNNIFVNTKFGILPKYQSVLHKNFNAAVESLDFGNAAAASKRINDWVAFNTKGRITDLVTPDAFSSRTQLVLANTIYFKGVWRQLFPEDKTTDEKFTKSDGKQITVPMMNVKALFRGGSDTSLGATWVELPYDGFDFSMIVVLPTKRLGLDQVISRLNDGHFYRFMNELYTKDITLKMPRFKLSRETPIVPALQKLGLKDIFDQSSNLSGISSAGTPLVVSDIFHKAEIEVNEAGTLASAGSVVFAQTLSFSPDYAEENFFIDQPYMMIIVDVVNKLPLFIARVSDPTKS